MIFVKNLLVDFSGQRIFGAANGKLVKWPDDTFYIYILTNPNRTTLYVGVTNNLSARVIEHWQNRGRPGSFAGKYYCFNLVYYERFSSILRAIAREKEIKKWNRGKKEALIRTKNPEWNFLNEAVCGTWPPEKPVKRF